MKQRSLYVIGLSLLMVLLTIGAEAAPAGPSPADLNIQVQGPTSAFVNSPYVYTATVSNTGGSNASDVRVVIDLPLTNTSPTVHILGTLSGIDNRCQVIANRLECNLGTIRKNRNVSFSYTFALPVSTKILKFTAVASTTSNEPNQGNNTVSLIPSLAYATNQLVSATVLNSHCTGQGLTSYFECELFPSSISQHTVTLVAGGSISFGVPGYTGTWSQPTPQQLYFNYFDGNNLMVAEFNGFATSATCFEGMTTFPQSPGYVSPYKVCVQ